MKQLTASQYSKGRKFASKNWSRTIGVNPSPRESVNPGTSLRWKSAYGGIDLGVTATDGIDRLLQEVSAYLPEEGTDLIRDAYEFADRSHEGQLRKSGDPYIAHPLEIALFLCDLRMDEQSIAAALLHDVVEDCDVSLEELTGRFGPEIGKLVDGVTKLSQLDTRVHSPLMNANGASSNSDNLYAESLRKMLVAMAEDIRVVLIKLADRLHNMKTLDALPPEKQRRIAQETLDIYSPLAHRLGIWEIKWQLEDLAFRYLNIEKYREISRMLAARRAVREAYVSQVSELLKDRLESESIKADVSGRPKNIYSTYRKMRSYEAQGKQLSEIYDLFALRVLVDREADCYRVLGIVHQLWHPLPGQIDDYIANPKENMYQALHTTVVCEGGSHLEVQIKTVDMHQVSEYGVAAHWRYKEGNSRDKKFEEKMSEFRQLLEGQRDATSTEEFIESVKQDIFRDQVFVYTPKGKIVELTAGSTPVDFAYKIHTELGHRCVGAKVNGRLVPSGHRFAERRHRGDYEHKVGPRSQLGLAQRQPRVRPVGQREAEYPPVVPQAGAGNQHTAGKGTSAARDATTEPEVRRQRNPLPLQIRHHGRPACEPGFRRCRRRSVGAEACGGATGAGASAGAETHRPAAVQSYNRHQGIGGGRSTDSYGTVLRTHTGR